MRAGVMAVRSTGYAWVVLILGLIASCGLYFLVQERVQSVAKLRFENRTAAAVFAARNWHAVAPRTATLA